MENERSTIKIIILNIDHQLEFFKQGISVSRYFPILSFAGRYSVGPLPKIWTPSLEFTLSKEMIIFIVTIHNSKRNVFNRRDVCDVMASSVQSVITLVSPKAQVLSLRYLRLFTAVNRKIKDFM